jgi:hypothetical protein
VKPVKPLIDLPTPVLDYETPQPRRRFDVLRQQIDELVEYVGGPGAALFMSTVACFGIGMSCPGPLGAALVFLGGVSLRFALNHWARASRW